jgi:hypothetical protein
MVMAALSPGSVIATPIQVNPQVRSDLQTSVPQVSQDAQKTAKDVQTDTITISAQALKMADDKNMAAKEADNKVKDQKAAQLAKDQADEQETAMIAKDKADSEQSEAQRNAVKAYAAVSANG